MKNRRWFGLGCLLPLLILFSAPPAAAAESDFSTLYDIRYDFGEAPQTKVDFQISVVNLASLNYVRQYTLNIASKNLKDIAAFDEAGRNLEFQTETTSELTKIITRFGNAVVGKGARLTWHITYIDESLGRKNGLVWNIAIPKFKDNQGLTEYTVSLSIPEWFGPEIYSSPKPHGIEKIGRQRRYHFDDPQLVKTGALLSFGDYQLYKFDLKYHLKNPNLFSSLAKITLPPNIRGEQQIIFQKILPPPQDVLTDADGNYLALYRLSNFKETIVSVEGLAYVSQPRRDLNLSGKFEEIPKNLTNLYLKERPYWETSDPPIAAIVAAKVNPQKSVSENAKQLFDYVAEGLQYDPQRINGNLNRFGAKKALQNTANAVCMEYADLLTTLLRRGGIPAQVLEGYAFTEDAVSHPVVGDTLHSWVRYYDPRLGWLSVDPTWASTSKLDYFSRLDVNHLVFAIKGESSTSPFPAGAYKINPQQTGDIKVSLKGETVSIPPPQIELGLKDEKSFRLPLAPSSPSLWLLNRGATTLFDVSVKIYPTENEEELLAEKRLGDVPAYAQRKMTLSGLSPRSNLKAIIHFTDFDGNYQSRTWSGQIPSAAQNRGGVILVLGIFLGFLLWAFRRARSGPENRRK